MQHIKTPVDLIGLVCLTKADVQQAIDTAYPYPKQGFIIWSETAPDVIADPNLAYFLWGKLVGLVPNKEIYYHDGTAWQLLPLVDGSALLDDSVPLDKIHITGETTAYDIIQVNSTNTALQWVNIINAIQNGTIPPAKLLVPGAATDYVLVSIAGVQQFATLAAFFALIGSNVIPVDALQRAGADSLGLYLRTKIDGTAIEWANVDVANLAAAAGSAGLSIRRNGTNTAWEFFTPSASSAPTFIDPHLSVYSGAPVAWTTVTDAAVLARLVGKKAAIIQIENFWNTSTDGWMTAEIRQDNTYPEIIVNRSGGADGSNCASQAIIPVTATGAFDFRVVQSVVPADPISSIITLVGYIG